MKKNVNGKQIEMTEQEAADWLASLPVPEPYKEKKTEAQLLVDKLVAKGLLTEADASELRAKK